MNITIIGTVAFDTIKTPLGKHEKILGGSATFSATAASLYANTAIVSIVGKDFPQTHFDYFKNKNINIKGIKIADGNTFHWSGYYEKDMNQAHTLRTDLNVLMEFDPSIPDSLKDSHIVFCANIDPVLQKKAIEQFTNPKLIVLDTMNFWIESKLDKLKETLKLVDILIINDQEIRLLTGIDNIIEALPKVLAIGPKRIIVKKGEHGSTMFDGQNYFMFPAFPLPKLIDPTGAGDTFAGGFIGYLAESDQKGQPLTEEIYHKAIITGTLCSSFTVQDFSVAALEKVTKEKLQDRFKELRSYICVPETI